MKYDEFRRELATGRIQPFYWFQGDEGFLIDQGMRAVVDAVLPGGQSNFGLVDLGADCTEAEIKRALLAPAFFGNKRVVRLREAGGLSSEAQEALAAAIKGLPSGTHVLIGGRMDGRRNATKALAAAAVVVECLVPGRGEAAAWARAHARTLGLTLDSQGAQLLVETIGPGLRQIAGELEKARTYLGGESSDLTAADLSVLLGREREDDVFKLVEAAAAGQTGQALRILADLLALGEAEVGLLALLARQVRQILLAGYLAAAGRRAEISRALGVPPFVADKLIRQAAGFPLTRCRALLERILRADVRIKTGEREAGVELELVVMEMAGAGGGR